MPPSAPEPPAAAAQSPAGGEVVAVAVALLEAAALLAAMRRVASWNPLRPLHAAADRAWVRSASTEHGAGGRTRAPRQPTCAWRCWSPPSLLGRGWLSQRPAAVGRPAPCRGLAFRWRAVRPIAGGPRRQGGRSLTLTALDDARVMIFHTTSRPALRAATCGGRPRPAGPAGGGRLARSRRCGRGRRGRDASRRRRRHAPAAGDRVAGCAALPEA
jgi:hypothetical protein